MNKQSRTAVKAHGGRFAYGVVETFLVLVIIVVLCFTAWFVHESSQSTKTALSNANKVAQSTAAKPATHAPSKAVASFDDCKKAAGSKLQETFPEQCVTTTGKSFTDTSESVAPPTTPKAAADSPAPAAGGCTTSSGTVVAVTLSEGVPNPRCSQVTASQTLTIVNPTAQTVTATLGGQSVTIPAGKSGVIATPFGNYLQPGDHVMQTGLYGGSGPEIYLPAN